LRGDRREVETLTLPVKNQFLILHSDLWADGTKRPGPGPSIGPTIDLPDGHGGVLGGFEVRAVIKHVGDSMIAGHYVVHVLDDEGVWWLLDDMAVSGLPLRDETSEVFDSQLSTAALILTRHELIGHCGVRGSLAVPGVAWAVAPEMAYMTEAEVGPLGRRD